MQRPRCSVFIATSLDGYIPRPDGPFRLLQIVQTPRAAYGFAAVFPARHATALR